MFLCSPNTISMLCFTAVCASACALLGMQSSGREHILYANYMQKKFTTLNVHCMRKRLSGTENMSCWSLTASHTFLQYFSSNNAFRKNGSIFTKSCIRNMHASFHLYCWCLEWRWSTISIATCILVAFTNKKVPLRKVRLIALHWMHRPWHFLSMKFENH